MCLEWFNLLCCVNFTNFGCYHHWLQGDVWKVKLYDNDVGYSSTNSGLTFTLLSKWYTSLDTVEVSSANYAGSGSDSQWDLYSDGDVVLRDRSVDVYGIDICAEGCDEFFIDQVKFEKWVGSDWVVEGTSGEMNGIGWCIFHNLCNFKTNIPPWMCLVDGHPWRCVRLSVDGTSAYGYD